MGDGVLCISATRTGRAGVLVGSISRMWTSSLLALGLVALALLGFAVFRLREPRTSAVPLMSHDGAGRRCKCHLRIDQRPRLLHRKPLRIISRASETIRNFI